MLLGLAVKPPWLGLGGLILALAAWTGLENGTLGGKAAWGLSRCLTTQSADHCMLVNEWVWLRSRVCLQRLQVDLGSVLVEDLEQKWRYGILKACIG